MDIAFIQDINIQRFGRTEYGHTAALKFSLYNFLCRQKVQSATQTDACQHTAIRQSKKGAKMDPITQE
jgi:hypothetical protein